MEHEDELFTVCLDDDGHPVLRAVRDMTPGEVIAHAFRVAPWIPVSESCLHWS
jgi:hypothetical protein